MEAKPHLFKGDRLIPVDWDIHELMYEVPGYGKPDIARYLASRERYRKELERLTLKSRFRECVDADERYELLKAALTSPDIQLRRVGAELVKSIDLNVRRDLQNSVDQTMIEILASPEPEKRLIVASMLGSVSDRVANKVVSGIRSSIEQYVGSGCFTLEKIGARMIALLPDSQDQSHYQALLYQRITILLSSDDAQHQIEATELMPYVSQRVMSKLIAEVLSGSNDEAQVIAVSYIKRLHPDLATPLLLQTLNQNNLSLKKIAAEAVTRLFRIHDKQPDIPPNISKAITRTVSDALASNDLKTQRIGVDMLKDIADTDELPKFIQKGMDSNDVYVRRVATKAIRFLSATEVLGKRIMRDFVRQALRSKDRSVQKIAVAIARHVPEPEKKECMDEAFRLVRDLLHSQDREKMKQGAEMAYHVTHPMMEDLFQILESDPELLEVLLYSRLYPSESEALDAAEDQDSRKLQRRVNFAKTGSEMTILRDGTLEGRLIIRHIKGSAFLAWTRALERHDVWLAAGFDYVPVEPIQSFMFRKKSVDVFTGILDIDLKHWLTVSGGRFEQELLEKRRQIMSILQQLKIRHGDLHTGNFFLKFFRRADGSINTKICPRLYVGDFDKAVVTI